MVRLNGQRYTLEERSHGLRLDKDARHEPSTSTPPCSPLSATLSHFRRISCSNIQLRSTEVVPLTTTFTSHDDSFHGCSSSANYHMQPSLNQSSSYAHVHHHQPHLAAPCACGDAAILANGSDQEHAACMEQLLHSPSLQGRTWRMFGSEVRSSPFRRGVTGFQCCFGSRSGCSGAGSWNVTEMLVHGSMLFTAHKDHNIRVWNLSTSPSCKHKLLNTLPTATDCFLNCFCDRNYVQVRRHHRRLWIKHVDNISAFAVASTCSGDQNNDHSVDHELLYSASWDKTVKVWRLSDFKCMESIIAHDDAVNAIAVRQELIYTASSDGTVKAWTKEAIKERKLLKSTTKIRHRLVATLPDHKCAVNALALSGDGNVLFSAGSDGMIRVWKRSDKDHGIAMAQCAHMTLCSVLEGHKRAVLCLCIAGDEVLLSGSADRTLKAWCIEGFKGKLNSRDADNGDEGILNQCCITTLSGHKSPIKWVSASSCLHGSGYTIYTGALDMSIKVWWLQSQSN